MDGGATGSGAGDLGDSVISPSDGRIPNGMEVFLTLDETTVFHARYESTTDSATVHGKELGMTHGRFYITYITVNAAKFPTFDPDIHCVGSTIAWPMKDIKERKRKTIEKAGTEALSPKLAEASPKKKRNENEWKRNVKKRKSNAGEEYQSVKRKGKEKGKVDSIKKRSMKEGCADNCSIDCSREFSDEIRKKINMSYLNLSSVNEKRAYITSHVTRHNGVARKRKRVEGSTKSRSCSYDYWFPDPTEEITGKLEGNRIRVCQKMFLNTLGISTTSIKTAFDKVEPATGVVLPDQRGRHDNHKKIDVRRENKVIEHIISFKVLESHYVRKKEKSQFLPKELNISEMHRMYLEFCETKGYEPETFDFYKRVFRRRFRLKFQKPKKDLCNKCTTYDALVTKTKEQEREHAQHLKDKDFVRLMKDDLKAKSKNDKSVVTAAFDLEQVLLSPFGATGAFYYSRRLKNHNLTITEIDTMTTHAYLWNEHEAKKGSCEVGSCLKKFITTQSENGKKIIYLFCDRCGGQNQNRSVCIALCNAMQDLDIEKIELIFLITGHSQNENDTAHSTIEQQYRNRFVYTPAQWETTIEQAFKTNKCHMNVIMHNDIINFWSKESFPEYTDVLKDKCFIMNAGKREKIKWASIKHLKFEAKEPQRMFFKYDLEEDFQSFIFRSNSLVTRGTKARVYYPLYDKPVGIPAKKKADLITLCEKGYIPPQHHAFYRSLSSNDENDDDNEKIILHGDDEH